MIRRPVRRFPPRAPSAASRARLRHRKPTDVGALHCVNATAFRVLNTMLLRGSPLVQGNDPDFGHRTVSERGLLRLVFRLRALAARGVVARGHGVGAAVDHARRRRWRRANGLGARVDRQLLSFTGVANSRVWRRRGERVPFGDLGRVAARTRSGTTLADRMPSFFSLLVAGKRFDRLIAMLPSKAAGLPWCYSSLR